jgi:hypothetical protein
MTESKHDLYELIATDLLKNGRLNLRDIPEERRTDWLCGIAVEADGSNYQDVPAEAMTPQLYVAAIRQSLVSLSEIPYGDQTQAVYIAAVQKDSGQLHYVPSEKRTKGFWREILRQTATTELCREAVQQNVHLLRYVPKEHRTAELCLDVVQRFIATENPAHYNRDDDKYEKFTLRELFAEFPDAALSEGLCLTVVRRASELFTLIPERLKTENLCVTAIEQDVGLFNEMPDKQKTTELCLKAFNGLMLKKYSESYRYGGDKWNPADDSDLRALLTATPQEAKTEQYWADVIKGDARFLQYVPPEQRTAAMYLGAIKLTGPTRNVFPYSLERFLAEMPVEMKTERFWLDALEQKGADALRCMPEALKTAAFYLVMAQHDGAFLEYIPSEEKTHAVCLAAIQRTTGDRLKDVLKHLPEKLKEPPFYLAMVEQNGMLLEYIAEDKRTLKVCIAAARNVRQALAFVPPVLLVDVTDHLDKI